jgi:hypothetical protein
MVTHQGCPQTPDGWGRALGFDTKAVFQIPYFGLPRLRFTGKPCLDTRQVPNRNGGIVISPKSFSAPAQALDFDQGLGKLEGLGAAVGRL